MRSQSQWHQKLWLFSKQFAQMKKVCRENRPLFPHMGIRLNRHHNKLDWHKLKLKQAIAAIVAQVTGRAFLGHDFCREPAWRDDIVRWSHQMITAARELHTWPKFLRPIVVWMLPSCKRLRETVEVTRRNLSPVIKERHAIIAARKENGESSETGSCALDWLEEVAQGRQYDPVAMQICLAFVGMDTTADLVFHVISDLSQDQELVNALREEIKSNLDGKRFTKQELQNLKLLDSVIKESQRLRPTGKGKILMFSEPWIVSR